MSVMSATVGKPAARATLTRLRASSRACFRLGVKAPLPHFTSSTKCCKPAASFLDKMLAVMSGTDGTVPVTSRMAYRRLSAGARLALAPTMAQPALHSVASKLAWPGFTL